MIITSDSVPGQCFLREHQSRRPTGWRPRLVRRALVAAAAAAGGACYGRATMHRQNGWREPIGLPAALTMPVEHR